ncbi:DUF937 domain-containing protein [Mycolicibacterium parafortuitum]|uniref:DUF937 domain-containing protein n=1 Tax=Mycolicibacterium parafortuitum TaxID=39692 RepID=A0A375YPF3_MYCPF|nr:DUF937 domain-containing protein [Mycolicibacterium parafortuitum]ORB26236.1 hypothetical protein BST38_26255 [Mycolicibacterium parafortuitum]SRX83016.1 hypothetical protein [Rhodococcus jostii RHA1] [Mycolicibacterium parafortuitum]
MADLDDLYAQIPTQQIAQRLGADENEVGSAVKTLLPVLVGGLQHNAADPGAAAGIAAAADNHAASGLLDGGVDVDQVDEADGSKAIAKIFGGNDTGQVASALSGGGAGNSELINKLLPILAPIVLAYIGRKLSGGQSAPSGQSGGGLGDILGGILGGGQGAGGGGDNPLGSILGSVLGGDKGGPLGDILGGLLGGRK